METEQKCTGGVQVIEQQTAELVFRFDGTERNGNFTVFMAPTVCSIMCATVQSKAARAATLSTLERKRSSFEAKTPHLALEGVESSLLEV